jgi:hypothetical protein
MAAQVELPDQEHVSALELAEAPRQLNTRLAAINVRLPLILKRSHVDSLSSAMTGICKRGAPWHSGCVISSVAVLRERGLLMGLNVSAIGSSIQHPIRKTRGKP